ncbi:MAG: lipopolysaccharide biosynthesis protein, partial [Bacteroidaceae bacterium]|nr:lipopolysaccharide biosynthesis protein [Bacteroidaceae bacterium]
MSDAAPNNKRIVKNTIFLYLRTIIIMLVSLYTTRAVLDALGVEDYGIYNLLGDIVVLFTFINNAMITSTQRYLNFELGKNDYLSA